MSCLNPVIIRCTDSRTDDIEYRRVRCRECEDCKQIMRSSAFVRMKFEYDHCIASKGMCFFFTLTFADEFVPFKFHRMCFDKTMIQDWLQRFRCIFRRHYGYTVKYLIVSELGHVGTHRPHHHGVFFLYPDDKYQCKSWKEGGKNNHMIPIFSASYCKVIRDCWQYGKCDVQEFDSSKGGFMYISKYISKDIEEDSLFKDIITRIQMKRGKSDCILPYNSRDKYKYFPHGSRKIRKRSQRNHLDYLVNTFPSLLAFKNRYCAFTMISQGLGASAEISYEDCVAGTPVKLDGFEYAIPRYYVDRYVRAQVYAHSPSRDFICPEDLDKIGNEQYYFNTQGWSQIAVKRLDSDIELHNVWTKVVKPVVGYIKECLPPAKLLEKYKVVDEFPFYHYENVPYYEMKFRNGKYVRVRRLAKASEVSSFNDDRKKHDYFNILSNIESRYYALPPILQNSCNLDIPYILLSAPDSFSGDDYFYAPTDLLAQALEELDQLERVASDWRARHRIAKREQDRKVKERRNSPFARRPLAWKDYVRKSHYMKMFNSKSHGKSKIKNAG